MAYSLNRLKAKNINVFFHVRHGSGAPDEAEWTIEAERLRIGLKFVLNPGNQTKEFVIETRKLLMQLIDEEFSRMMKEYDASQASN
jgi:hypothetical protein